MNARWIAAVAVLAAGPAFPAQTLESAYRTNGTAVQAAFEPVQAVLQSASAVVRRGNKEICYGTVMTPDGFILTKASEVGDGTGLTVTVGDQLYRDPVLLSTDAAWDVALLKIQAEGLVPVALALDQPDPPRGTWVVANGATSRSQRRVQVGIISSSAREIPWAGGPVLGVGFEEKDGKLVVTSVAEGGGAAAAGVEKGDILRKVGGEAVAGAGAFGELIGQHGVGDKVLLVVEREGKELELEVELRGRTQVFGAEPDRNDMMSGRFSERRSGFPRVIQHDIIADRHRVGGPVLDLDGRCLGMNIARANRCETFAIPAADLKSLADRMISQVK